MAVTVIDTAGWRVVVPLRAPLDLTGSRLTATIACQFGGRVVDLDSANLVPGYDGAREIDWTAGADGLSDHLVFTVTRAMRGGWLAMGAQGRPGPAALFADVKRTLAGSLRDPELIGRTSFMAAPGTDSPAVAAAAGGYSPVLAPIQGLQPITAAALVTGPQGPAGDTTEGDQILSLSAMAPVSGHRVVRGVNGSVVICSIANPDDADTAIGITEGAALAGAPVSVRYGGPMTDTTWAWVEGPVFAGPDGLLTQIPPRAAFEQRVGTAISPTQIVVEIEPAFIFAA